MDKKTASYLGFARKSGNLITGTDTCMRAGKSGRIKLLIICEDTAEGSKKKMVKLARDNGIEYRIFGSSEQLSHAAGHSSRYIFGITDAGFADVIIDQIDKNREVSL
jgi:ribosomal protein L7Ae-like RNA K-turn-binding protein